MQIPSFPFSFEDRDNRRCLLLCQWSPQVVAFPRPADSMDGAEDDGGYLLTEGTRWQTYKGKYHKLYLALQYHIKYRYFTYKGKFHTLYLALQYNIKYRYFTYKGKTRKLYLALQYNIKYRYFTYKGKNHKLYIALQYNIKYRYQGFIVDLFIEVSWQQVLANQSGRLILQSHMC